MSFHVGWKKADRCKGLAADVAMDLERVRGTDRVNERIENIVIVVYGATGTVQRLIVLFDGG